MTTMAERERMPLTERLLLRVPEAADMLGICRVRVYGLLNKGELESVLIGSSRRIPREAVEEYVRRQRVSERGEQSPEM